VNEPVIKFGTDGWRAQIADDYTFASVRRCAQGFASYLQSKKLAEQGVIIGYDKRFHSENFAAACAEVLAAGGIRVWLTDGPTPTPVISYAVKARSAAARSILRLRTIPRPITASRCVIPTAARSIRRG